MARGNREQKPKRVVAPTRCACGKFRQGSIGAPSQKVLTIRFNPETRDRSLDALQWGLIPYWAKDPKIAYRTINAQAETIDKAPLFRQACSSSVRLDPGDWLIARMAA
jgi:putative SOS response-associated peptidase YedK